MNSQLRKELSLLTGCFSVAAAVAGSTKWRRRWGWLSFGLMISSLARRHELKGKSVFITGGSRGLGLSLAWNALRRGARVTLVARDKDELARGKDILRGAFPNAEIYICVCDVTEPGQLQAAIEQAIQQMKGIDLLVNNAGAILVGPQGSMTNDDFEAQMQVHLYAAINATKFVLEHFKDRGEGHILNISSLGGKVAVPHMLPYAASKFALAGYSQGLAAELAPLGVCVTTAYPTVMRTGSPIQAVFKGDHEREFMWFQSLDVLPGLSLSADEAAKRILDAVEKGQTEVILSVPAKVRVMAGYFFPETVNAMMAFAARLLPKGESTLAKTGAASRSKFARSRWLKPLRERADKVEAEYNEVPRFDADHTLGLKH